MPPATATCRASSREVALGSFKLSGRRRRERSCRQRQPKRTIYRRGRTWESRIGKTAGRGHCPRRCAVLRNSTSPGEASLNPSASERIYRRQATSHHWTFIRAKCGRQSSQIDQCGQLRAGQLFALDAISLGSHTLFRSSRKPKAPRPTGDHDAQNSPLHSSAISGPLRPPTPIVCVHWDCANRK